MDIQEKIQTFEDSISEFSAQIDKVVKIPGVGLSSFILTCCLIDTVSSYTISVPGSRNSETYKRLKFRK